MLEVGACGSSWNGAGSRGLEEGAGDPAAPPADSSAGGTIAWAFRGAIPFNGCPMGLEVPAPVDSGPTSCGRFDAPAPEGSLEAMPAGGVDADGAAVPAALP